MTPNQIVYITLFCAIFCFDWSTQDRVEVEIKTSSVLLLRQQAEVCSKEMGVGGLAVDNLKKIIDKTLPDDRTHKEFTFCVLHNTGYATDDGHFDVEKMLTLDVKGSSDEYVNTLKECNNISNADNVELITAVAKCVHDKYNFIIQK